ncbi:hypothetical protein PHMEG_0002517 [Phytophthora megakarya]|uniref:Reverse transcriptase n=1 Tax=Phytophthora megakarya TaxID=4795 RepID=A0A225WYX1_9STRA|nr:hypothetical protein PHMEG_0002517 [Phytophthora megakarya]
MPALVGPLHVMIQMDVAPHRIPPYRHEPLQAQFVREYVGMQIAIGIIEQNNASRWERTVAWVSKPGSRDQFQLAIDYRLVNRLAVPIAYISYDNRCFLWKSRFLHNLILLKDCSNCFCTKKAARYFRSTP